MESHTIALVGGMHNLRSESSADKLRTSFVGDGFQQSSHGSTVLSIEVGVDFVENDHGAALSLLQRKDKAQRAQTLLTTTELLDSLLLVQVLRVERDADAHTNVIFNTASSLLVGLVTVSSTICAALDNETAVTGRYKLSKDGGKLLGYLLEGTLNGFILSAIEMFNELFNRPLRGSEFFSSLHQLILLCGEVVVLFKSLLVDMLVLLQCFVDLLEFGRDLLYKC